VIDALPRFHLDSRPRHRSTLHRPSLTGERKVGSAGGILQQRDAAIGQHQNGELIARLLEKCMPGELLDVPTDLSDARVSQQAERAQRLVTA
jgi:hypothetical protein